MFTRLFSAPPPIELEDIYGVLDTSKTLPKDIDKDSEIKFSANYAPPNGTSIKGFGFYTNSKKPTGHFAATTLTYFFRAFFGSSADQANHQKAVEEISKHIKLKYPYQYNAIMNRLTSKASFTVGELRGIIKEEYEKTLLLAALEPPEAQITKLKDGSPTDIKNALAQTELGPDKTQVTIITGGEQTLSAMGFSTFDEKTNEYGVDPIVPQGHVTVFGKKQREAIMDNFNLPDNDCKTDFNAKALAEAEHNNWDRLILSVNGKHIPISRDGFTTADNLKKFKQAIQTLTNAPISDQQAYEMMLLIDQEGAPAGRPTGSNRSTGLGFGREGIPNKDGATVEFINITLEKEKFHFNYTSGREYLTTFMIPSAFTGSNNSELRLNSIPDAIDPCSNNPTTKLIDRHNNLDIPQFETATKYTYSYKPPLVVTETSSQSRAGSTSPKTVTFSDQLEQQQPLKERVEIIDSRQAYWRAPVRGEASKEASNQLLLSLKENPISLNNPTPPGSGNPRRIHNWEDDSEKTPNYIPAISDEFFGDFHRTNYFIQERGKEAKSISSKQAATSDEIQEFINFVGKDRALLMSQYANQAIPQELTQEILATADGPFRLPEIGSGVPMGPIKSSYTFSKSDNGDIVLHLNFQQKPTTFNSVTMKDGKKVIGEAIFLENSFVNMNFDITFEQSGLIKEVSPIQYEYHLEQKKD